MVIYDLVLEQWASTLHPV